MEHEDAKNKLAVSFEAAHRAVNILILNFRIASDCNSLEFESIVLRLGV